MARDFHAYREVAVHSLRDPRSGLLVIRPMPGQAFAPTLKVQCSRRLRTDYPVGTSFLLNAKLTDRLGGPRYLYAYNGDPIVVLSPDEAQRFLAAFRRGRI